MQIHYTDQLSELKLTNFKSVEEYFLQFEKICNQCKAAGGKLEEKEKIVYLTKALPDNYGHVKLLTNLIPTGVKKLEFVKEKIRELSIINKQMENKPSVSTFSTTTKNNNCFTFNKPGHKQRNCWSNKNNNQNQQYQQQQQRSYGNQRGRSRGRGRGGSSRGRGNNQYQQQRDSTSSQQHHDVSTWALQLNHNQVEVKSEMQSENKMKWLLDSGCTDH